MCTGLEIAAIASTVAAGAGQVMNRQAARKTEKRYNEQVNQQNRLLEQQYSDRQKKIYAAKDQQADTFNQIANQQDEEFANQKALQEKKAQLFQDVAKQPVNTAAAPEAEQARADRNKLFADTDITFAGGYNPTANGTTEDRVLRTAADKANLNEKTRTGGIADAQARIGAQGDVQQKQGGLFRDMSAGMNSISGDAQAGQRALEMRLRRPQYRMGALGASMGEQANTPYFRGVEPQMQQPNTLFGDLLTGTGQIGTQYFTTKLPKAVA